MFAGKIIAGLIGFSALGPLGLMIGLYVGHQFDKGLGGLRPMSAQQQAEVRESYFQTVFGLLGHLAKADGRISAAEIALAEALMSKMGLSSSHRKQAIELFKSGSKNNFSVDDTMHAFMSICGRHTNLKRSLLNDLISLAIADGELHQAEEELLRTIAGRLGFSAALFNQFIAMIKAQSQFKDSGTGGGYQSQTSASQLSAAYTALGVEASNSDTQIKRAYRKLISENHPDKLIGQGMPEDMVQLATERTQEIQTAYDLIVESRK
jgi:DnaJ like chaperone protein